MNTRAAVMLSVASGLAIACFSGVLAATRAKKEKELLYNEGDQAEVLITNCPVKGTGGTVGTLTTGVVVTVTEDAPDTARIVAIHTKHMGRTYVGWVNVRNLRRIPKAAPAAGDTNAPAAREGVTNAPAAKEGVTNAPAPAATPTPTDKPLKKHAVSL